MLVWVLTGAMLLFFEYSNLVRWEGRPRSWDLASFARTGPRYMVRLREGLARGTYRRGIFGAVPGMLLLPARGFDRTELDLEVGPWRFHWQLRTHAYDDPYDLDRQKRTSRNGITENGSAAYGLDETVRACTSTGRQDDSANGLTDNFRNYGKLFSMLELGGEGTGDGLKQEGGLGVLSGDEAGAC